MRPAPVPQHAIDANEREHGAAIPDALTAAAPELLHTVHAIKVMAEAADLFSDDLDKQGLVSALRAIGETTDAAIAAAEGR